MKIKFLIITLLAAIFVACAHDQSNNKTDSASASHEEVNLKLTSYNPNYEVFAEATPFVVGKSSRVLSHFTHLPEFNAVIDGSITIRLIVGNKEVTQQLLTPTRKGIYDFNIIPDRPGKGQIAFDILNNKGKSQLVISDITVFANEDEAGSAARAAEKKSPFAAVFTKEQSWKVDFATETALTEPFGQVISTTAQVLNSQIDAQILTARTSGLLKFVKVGISEGKKVVPGELLFTISGSGMAENNHSVRFTEAGNNYEKAKADYERMKELAKDKIISEKDLLIAKNQFENTKTIFDNLSSNFDDKGQNIHSTMNGFVNQVFVQNGQYIEAGQPIIKISQNKTLIMRADLQQKYAPFLDEISNVNISTQVSKQIFTLSELKGKVLSYGRNANPDNYMIPLTLQIENNGSFTPGSFAEILIKTATGKHAITIPNTALLEEQGNYFVYVQIHPELFEKREVHTGGSDGFRTEIIKGISENERIVSKGAILIKLAQATGTLDAHSGHNH